MVLGVALPCTLPGSARKVHNSSGRHAAEKTGGLLESPVDTVKRQHASDFSELSPKTLIYFSMKMQSKICLSKTKWRHHTPKIERATSNAEFQTQEAWFPLASENLSLAALQSVGKTDSRTHSPEGSP